MGLLRRIIGTPEERFEKGLLKRAEDIRLEYQYSFESIAKKLFLEKIAIYKKENSVYSLEFSYGLDDKTKEKSYSSVDFWNGTLFNSNWNKFSKSLLIPLMQFLSERDKQKINCIYVKKIDKQHLAFIPIEKTELTELQLNNINDTLYEYLNSEDVKILSAFNQKKMAALLTISGENILDYYQYIKPIISSSEFCIISDDIIKIILFVREEISIDKFQQQLEKEIKKIGVEVERNSMLVESAGYSTSFSDVKAFIK